MNSPPRILIVEDQFFIAVDCELHLRTAGMECVGVAATAASALDLAERERPDLIIMDIHLASRVGGIEAAIVIYERLGIRCIFTSSHIEELTEKDAERARPLARVDKPYSGEKLITTVRRALDELGTEQPVRQGASTHGPQRVH